MRSQASSKKFQLKAEINLVPFIDVVLVLLIVFMIATPIVTQGVKVNLPQVTTQPINQTNQNNWILTLKSKQKIFLNTGGDRERANTPTSLERVATLVKMKTQKNPKLVLYVRADKSIPYGEVMKALGYLQKQGLHKVGLITEPE